MGNTNKKEKDKLAEKSYVPVSGIDYGNYNGLATSSKPTVSVRPTYPSKSSVNDTTFSNLSFKNSSNVTSTVTNYAYNNPASTISPTLSKPTNTTYTSKSSVNDATLSYLSSNTSSNLKSLSTNYGNYSSTATISPTIKQTVPTSTSYTSQVVQKSTLSSTTYNYLSSNNSSSTTNDVTKYGHSNIGTISLAASSKPNVLSSASYTSPVLKQSTLIDTTPVKSPDVKSVTRSSTTTGSSNQDYLLDWLNQVKVTPNLGQNVSATSKPDQNTAITNSTRVLTTLHTDTQHKLTKITPNIVKPPLITTSNTNRPQTESSIFAINVKPTSHIDTSEQTYYRQLKTQQSQQSNFDDQQSSISNQTRQRPRRPRGRGKGVQINNSNQTLEQTAKNGFQRRANNRKRENANNNHKTNAQIHANRNAQSAEKENVQPLKEKHPRAFKNQQRRPNPENQAENDNDNIQPDNRSSKNEHHISLKRIEDLLNKNPEDIILNLMNPKFNFGDYLDAARLGDKLIVAMARLIEKALECNSISVQLRYQIDRVVYSNFFCKHLYNHFCKTSIENAYLYDLSFVECIMRICIKFLYLNPPCNKKVAVYIGRIEMAVNRANNDELIMLMSVLINQHHEAEKKCQKQKFYTFANRTNYVDTEPSNDITQMSIIPDLNDVLENSDQFLRKNITNGAYKDVDHYLDVQFRLLREDFMSPLRNGVSKLREIVQEEKITGIMKKNSRSELKKNVIHKIKRIESLSAYFDTNITSFVSTDNGVAYAVKVNLDGKSINWDAFKKLMFGSLVCLSCDYFDRNCLIGVIVERDKVKLKKEGVIHVQFYNDNPFDTFNQPSFNHSYIMLETSAYFESYKYVLEALVWFKQTGEAEFPFKENIVLGQNKAIINPGYLDCASIDFRPLVDLNKIPITDSKSLETFQYSASSAYAKSCLVSYKNSWPTAAQMNLDDSQYKAIQLALENKLALIQGPPGTGKTFLGVKLVQLLLQNKNLWWNRGDERHRPILMVCYTNHALDQFLEYCINECNLTSGVVRVGGQSKSLNLNAFKLANIKDNLRRTRKTNPAIFHSIRNERTKLADLRSEFDEKLKRIQILYSGYGVLEFEQVKMFMSDQHKDLFEQDDDFYGYGADFSLLKWLGFFDNVDKEQLYQDLDDDDENAQNSEEKSEYNKNAEANVDEKNIESEKNENASENEKDPEQNSENVDDESTKNEKDKINIDEDKASDGADSMNDERMIEVDYEDVDELLKKEEQIRVEIINCLDSKKRSNNMISCSEIENIRTTKMKLRPNKNEWTHVGSKGKKQKNLNETELHLNNLLDSSRKLIDLNPTVKDLIRNEPNIYRLNYNERFLLYLTWLDDYQSDQETDLREIRNQLNECSTSLRELRLQEDRSIMEDALIIAMTTTGSSRYHTILKDIGPRIVIVEEAAEVFETHIIAGLSKHCEHLILIGDHVQLRPNPAVYILAKEYNFDVSLFERLLNNDVKKVMLKCQHRMRPEISVLMKHFYEEPIQDDASVFKFESIRGLKNNIFFINHNNLEQRMSDGTTKKNMYEVEYITKFCFYLAKQDYGQDKITMLSMYLGQMGEIKKSLRSVGLPHVKVTTVDNYQGEENDIIILSLVRSNKENKIGFLNIKNRICVALSRARKGLYVIGNLNFICNAENAEDGGKWKNIVRSLKETNSIGNNLILTCGKHPKNDIAVVKPADFDARPDGGCRLPCDFRLKCGHVCALKCHTYDLKHEHYKCGKSCDKVIPKCGHICNLQCQHGGECLKCGVQVPKKIEECGHTIMFRCDKEPNKKDCTAPCEKVLSCGHRCTKKCGISACEPCETKIDVTISCKHLSCVQVKCSDNVWDYQKRCSKICNDQLDCGHVCKKKCSDCLGGRIHAKCSQKCDRILFCGHECPNPCSNQCQPCDKPCSNRCVHSKCSLKCSQPCISCREPCTYACEHFKCTKLCNEICDRPPCDQPCNIKLPCGHDCIGFCGERCPPLCRICDKDTVCEIFFGTEDDDTARFVYLEDCHHVVEADGMDQWMKTTSEESESTIQLPRCPKCKTPIRTNLRYCNYVKKQLMSIEKIKLQQFGSEDRNKKEQFNLVDEVKQFIKTHKLFKGDNRKSPPSKDFEFSMNMEEQLNLESALSFNEIVTYRNLWTFYKQFFKLRKSIEEKYHNDKDLSHQSQLSHLNYETVKIWTYIYRSKLKLVYGQQLRELFAELERITSILNYYMTKNSSNKVQLSAQNRLSIAQNLCRLEQLLITEIHKYEGKIKDEAANLFKELSGLVKIELTKEERTMIIEAMNLKQGHWYNCPNGHVFCIGECGRPMQQSVCPECKAPIGGQNHAMVAGVTQAANWA